MKKLLLILLFLAMCYTTYYDLSKGTLENKPTTKAESTKTVTAISPQQESKEKVKDNQSEPMKTVKVEPGDTVLSIVEKLNPKIPVPIQQVLTDFQKLNPDIDPNHIEIGKDYKFPLYN